MRARGFTSAELIVCLVCIMAWLPLVYVSLQQLQHWKIEEERILEQQIAFGQLRMALAYYDVTDVTSDCIMLKRGEKEANVSVVNQKLMIRPGTSIVLGDVEQITFYTEGYDVYAVISHQQKSYEYWIATLPMLY